MGKFEQERDEVIRCYILDTPDVPMTFRDYSHLWWIVNERDLVDENHCQPS